MLDFTGVKCPVCGVPFGKDDDIVVCPECGAPYHRTCYQQAGHCIFTDLHEQGKEWMPPAPPKAPETSAEVKDRECSVCGTLNGHNAQFCSRCGAPLQVQRPYGGQAGTPQNYSSPVRGSGPMPPFAFDPMGGVSPAEYLDDGVTFGDVSKLVRQNTNYYMPVFRFIRHSGRNKFNFSAFLFSGAWMLYRKQYKYGAVVTALMFFLYLLYQFSLWLVSWPCMIEAAKQAGISNMGLEEFVLLSDEQRMSIAGVLSQNIFSLFKMFLPFLFLGGILVIMIVVGVRGNKMYMNHCIAVVHGIKTWDGGDDPGITIEKKGGVNPVVSACIFVCYMVLRNLISLLLL